MAECILFAYGLLQPGYRPPKTMTRHEPDAVRGQLFDLGPYPGAVKLGVGPNWIEGQAIWLDASELGELDAFEGVAFGQYERVRVTTREGRTAWAYQYARPLRPEARAIPISPAPPAESASDSSDIGDSGESSP